MLDLEKAEDCCTIVRHRNVLVYLSADSLWRNDLERTPISSTIILSKPLGPKELLTMFEIL